MIPFLVLLLALLIFRGLGAAGVDAFSSWTVAARYALALMFLVAASAHFNSMKEDLIRMVPKAVPYPRQVVLLTGVLEILGAIGLLVPVLYRTAGVALIVFLVAVFPANIQAVRAGTTLRGKRATPLWVRLPMQLVYIGLTGWTTFGFS